MQHFERLCLQVSQKIYPFEGMTKEEVIEKLLKTREEVWEKKLASRS